MSISNIMPSIEDLKHLQIPLQHIKQATNGFASKNFTAKGGFGCVYKGMSEKHGQIAVKRLDRSYGQGDREFKTEILLLSKYKHKNIVSLCGFCDEDGEKILVYKYESNGSLDKYLIRNDLTWIQRLHICLDAGHGLQYVHNNVGSHLRVIHCDVKSSNILLDEKWKAKICDFGLSKVQSACSQNSFVISSARGTPGYIDPYYFNEGYLTQKSDVYSFGVVLWEVLCGRHTYSTSYKDDHRSLAILAEKHYVRKTLDRIIPSYLRKQMNKESLLTFSNIAYRCLKNVEERPTMKQVVEQLQKALYHQQKAEAVRDEKKSEESEDLTPPARPRQELVLNVYLHCEGCARKLRGCLIGFEGVQDVSTDCKTNKLVVRGEKTDPLKVLERVQKEISQGKVEVLLPVPVPKKPMLMTPVSVSKMPQAPVTKPSRASAPVSKFLAPVPVSKLSVPDQEKRPKQQEKKDKPLSAITVLLKVQMNCKACAQDIKKCIMMMKGVESVFVDQKKLLVEVKGTFLATELVDYVHKKTGKVTMIIKNDLMR